MRQPERASWVFASWLLIYAGATTRLPAFRLLHLVGNLGLGWLDVAGDIANVEEKPRHAVHRSGGRRLPSSAARSLPPCRAPQAGSARVTVTFVTSSKRNARFGDHRIVRHDDPLANRTCRPVERAELERAGLVSAASFRKCAH
jgi:hypothetical protein